MNGNFKPRMLIGQHGMFNVTCSCPKNSVICKTSKLAFCISLVNKIKAGGANMIS